MISEQDFINSVKKYNAQDIDFDSLEYINEVLGGTIRPILKRGIAPNEFTIIKLAGYEEVNNDTILTLFDIIPPGPKEIERVSTHSIIGRNSQGLMLTLLIEIGTKKYLILQKRNPLSSAFSETIEIYRDYIDKNVSLNEYLLNKFGKLLETALSHEVISTGYFWENTGILGVNVMSALITIKLDKKTSLDKLTDIINTSNLCELENIIGKRSLIVESLDKIKKHYDTSKFEDNSFYLSDVFSITSLAILFKCLI